MLHTLWITDLLSIRDLAKRDGRAKVRPTMAKHALGC